MPLDPANAAFLEQAAQKPRTPLSETTVEEMRAEMEALVPLGFAPEEVHEVAEFAVEGLPVRCYRPSPDVEATVLWLHGGSFTRCGLSTHDSLYRYFANRSGVEVVAVDYSLAPEATYPRQLEEAARVARWMADRGTGSARKTYIAGESSGGALAAALTLKERDRQQAEPGSTVSFDGLLLVVPVLDRDSGTVSRRELAVDYLLTDEQMQWMFDQYAPGAAADDPYVYPFRASNLTGLPHTMVVTAEFDPLRDEGREFADRVRAAGGTAEHHCVRGLTHHAPLVVKAVPRGAELIDRAAASVRTHAAS